MIISSVDAIEYYEAGDQVTIKQVRFKDERREVVEFVPGDKMWVIERRSDIVRVRCPDTGEDNWINMSELRNA